MKLKQYFSCMFAFLIFASSTIFASEFHNSDTIEDEINFEVDFTLGNQVDSYYIEDYYAYYLYATDFYKVIDIIPFDEIYGDTSKELNIIIPGGIITMFSEFSGDVTWYLHLHNVGFGTVTNLRAVVNMYNEYDEIRFSTAGNPRPLGALAPGQTRRDQRFFAGGSQRIHRATIVLSGSTSGGNFSMSGEQTR